MIARLLTSAKLLHANAVGCAVNHYGEDFVRFHGNPGWLSDCEKDILAAEKVADMLVAVLARAKRAEAESFTLAANLCEAPGSDEYGNHECQTIKTLRAELAKVTGERDAAREYAKEARLAEKAAEERRIHDTDALRVERDAAREALAVATTERDKIANEENSHYVRVLRERDAMFAALEPFARLADTLVDDGLSVAVGLTDDHFLAARSARALIAKLAEPARDGNHA